ncbi:MAG: tRNA 4-thiouridine(8) synthase ThiI [Spirochaetes bacterium]|nr:tRNA 4-thiouridine(8) synthase ThiI [Spirochaetota bacterium]
MDIIYLIKIGEIILKLGNRREFEDRLRYDLKRRLSGIPARIEISVGRYFLHTGEEHAPAVELILSRTPGVNGFAKAFKREKNMDEIAAAAVLAAREASDGGASSFKVESRRSDKSFPLDSYAISAAVGEIILEKVPALRVDVRNPDVVINVEIRDKAFIYGRVQVGQKGLPVGVSGKGLLLLSGGIDSPVAGWMMAKRGLSIEALYFHAYPYTSDEALGKVKRLAELVADYAGEVKLHVASFTEVQLAIKKRADESRTTLYMRGAMMRVAHRVAAMSGAHSIITGESLGQVASQTAENLRFTGSFTDLAILRPLVGIDKEDTIRMAKAIGTYETSILPFEDCCVLFSPRHPILKAVLDEERKAYDAMELDPLLDETILSMLTFRYGF